MAGNHEDMVAEIKAIHISAKKALEVISKIRVECAQLQLELLKLLTPECIEILESLKQVTVTADPNNNS